MNRNAVLQQALMIRLERRYAQRFIEIRRKLIGSGNNLEAMYPVILADNAAALKDMYTASTLAMGRLVLGNLRKGHEMMETKRSSDFWLSTADYWFRKNGLRQAANISQTAMADASRILSQSLQDGQGATQTGKQLQAYLSISRARAVTIARTEVHAAAMFAGRETAEDYQQQTGLQLLKRWDATFDARTREDHLAMNDHPAIPMKESFDVGGTQMDRPGDPAGGAEQVINCRCVLTYEDDFIER